MLLHAAYKQKYTDVGHICGWIQRHQELKHTNESVTYTDLLIIVLKFSICFL